MIRHFKVLNLLLALAFALAWVPTIRIHNMSPRLQSVSSSRRAVFFDVSCRSLAHHHIDDEPSDFSLEPPSVVGIDDEWITQLQGMGREELVQKTINAVVLIVCFGFSIYTILSVDHEITRGWTQQEIAMRIPLDNWASYESALQEKPIMTKTFINVVIYCLGDWLSQTVFQKKNVLDFDVKRTLRNGFIGLCFGPLVHQYYEWSDHILPVEGGLFNRLRKILMDQTLYLSVKCSIYIAAVGFLQGDSLDTVTDSVKTRIGPICFTAWKFWPLVHCITYSVIPAQHRILWVNCVDLVWNAILSTMSRKEEPESVPLLATESPELLSAPVFATAKDEIDDDDCRLGEMMLIPDQFENVTEALALDGSTNASEIPSERLVT